MLEGKTPAWLLFLEKRIGWLAVPNISILLVTLQALGFLLVTSDPIWVSRLALVPGLVLAGEPWRLITFLALPLSYSMLSLFFVLWFLYFIVNGIESEWGSFKTTFYILVSLFVTIAFSFAFDYPVIQVKHFESTLFLAAAALFPEMEIRLFFAIPVKIKWLAWLTLAFLALEFLKDDWVGRLYLIAIYSNYLLFFGPAHLNRLKQEMRRRKFKSQMRG